MATKRICAAVATALARNPDLLRNQTSRLQPARVPPPWWHAEFLASGMVLATARLPRDAAVVLDFPSPREFLLRLVPEFFRAFVPLFHAFWLSQLLLVQATLPSCVIFPLHFSVLALGSGIFSVFVKRQAARVFHWVLVSELPPLLRPILSPASLYEGVEIPLPLATPRYRASISPLPLSLLRPGWAIVLTLPSPASLYESEVMLLV